MEALNSPENTGVGCKPKNSGGIYSCQLPEKEIGDILLAGPATLLGLFLCLFCVWSVITETFDSSLILIRCVSLTSTNINGKQMIKQFSCWCKITKLSE